MRQRESLSMDWPPGLQDDEFRYGCRSIYAAVGFKFGARRRELREGARRKRATAAVRDVAGC
eukprot:546635-Pyramimonas_sp.AAC.1